MYVLKHVVVHLHDADFWCSIFIFEYVSMSCPSFADGQHCYAEFSSLAQSCAVAADNADAARIEQKSFHAVLGRR